MNDENQTLSPQGSVSPEQTAPSVAPIPSTPVPPASVPGGATVPAPGLAEYEPYIKKIAKWAFWIGILNIISFALQAWFIDYMLISAVLIAVFQFWVSLYLPKANDLQKIVLFCKLYAVSLLGLVGLFVWLYGFSTVTYGILFWLQMFVVLWMISLVQAVQTKTLPNIKL